MDLAHRFNAAFADHKNAVHTFAAYYLGDGTEADDVTQEVFIKLHRHLPVVEPGRERAWLMTTTRNACIDTLRKHKSHAKMVQLRAKEPTAEGNGQTADPPDETLESQEFLSQLERAVAELDEPYRSIVMLREMQELSYAEICEALDMPMSRVKVYLHRGRRRLREVIRERMAHGDVEL